MKQKQPIRRACFAIALFSAITFNVQADFDVGLAAYNRGDYVAALSEWKHDAAKGHAGAQQNLGVMYATGRGVAKDDKEAVRWYRLAADQGDARAQNGLGWMHQHGTGVLQDFEQAVRWYRLAAQQGNAYGQRNLGLMYRDGLGVPQNLIVAHAWLNLGANGGHPDAQGERDRVAESLTTKDLVRAQKLATAWQPGKSVPEVKYQPKTPSGKTDAKAPTPAKVSEKSCNPPSGKTLRYSDKCVNGDCVRTFENGCTKQFQAAYCYDSLKGRWDWKPDGC